jgi:hypothetical protein
VGLTRKSTFGFPNPSIPGSVNTWRAVPLTQGVRLDQPWPLLPPGSTTSCTNFVPLDGKLVPRSRLSSINTIQLPGSNGGVLGLTELTYANQARPTIWWSTGTGHGIVMSNGSLSRASFISSFGLGIGTLQGDGIGFQYSQTFDGNLNDNMVLAVGRTSYDTILALYLTSGVPQYSYLTSAPKARSIGAHDNYVVAFNTRSATTNNTRVQWSVRGNASNWTSEGSGFDDLLAMRGVGTAVRGTSDGRLILWSTLETWYGVSATYPAQFTFYPLDQNIGCPAPATIQECDEGILFFGSDYALRLLPKGGGASRVVSQQMAEDMRYNFGGLSTAEGMFGVYDPLTKLYHLFAATNSRPAYVLNVVTGEWGRMFYTSNPPKAGLAMSTSNSTFGNPETLLFGNSSGTITSTNSKAGTEHGSVVTSTWQSPPLGSDLAGNHKQVTKVCLDYRSTSTATLTQKISQDGGNTYQSVGETVVLNRAPVSGRAEKDVYIGGAFPAIELTSTSTGFELHRLDVSMNIAGRK